MANPGPKRTHPREVVEKVCDLRVDRSLSAGRIARIVKLRESQVAGILWRHGFYGSHNDNLSLSSQDAGGSNKSSGGGR